MKASGRVWLVFLGVFLAGAVAGGFVSLRFAERSKERRGPDDLALRFMQRYASRLELTDVQRQAIQPSIEQAAAELHRIRGQAAETMQAMERAIARELTPVQREKLDAMQAEQRERWRRWMEKRREHEASPAEGGPPHRAPPPPEP